MKKKYAKLYVLVILLHTALHSQQGFEEYLDPMLTMDDVPIFTVSEQNRAPISTVVTKKFTKSEKNEAIISAQAQKIIQNIFASVDAYVDKMDTAIFKGGYYSESDMAVQSKIQTIVTMINKCFDDVGKSIGASTESMKPIKQSFAYAITFFGTQSPNDINRWLPKIIDAAKIVVTAPVKLAIRIAGAGVGSAVGAPTRMVAGVQKSAYNRVKNAKDIATNFKTLRQSQDLITAMKTAAKLTVQTIHLTVATVVEPPVLMAYETAVGLYVGGRIGHDVTKRNITGNILSSKPSSAWESQEIDNQNKSSEELDRTFEKILFPHSTKFEDSSVVSQEKIERGNSFSKTSDGWSIYPNNTDDFTVNNLREADKSLSEAQKTSQGEKPLNRSSSSNENTEAINAQINAEKITKAQTKAAELAKQQDATLRARRHSY